MKDHPVWSPTSGTSTAGVSPARATFRIPDRILGGVARVVNAAATIETFTLGDSNVTNTMQIPVPPRSSMFIAFGPDDTHISASAVAIRITPGIARP